METPSLKVLSPALLTSHRRILLLSTPFSVDNPVEQIKLKMLNANPMRVRFFNDCPNEIEPVHYLLKYAMSFQVVREDTVCCYDPCRLCRVRKASSLEPETGEYVCDSAVADIKRPHCGAVRELPPHSS